MSDYAECKIGYGTLLSEANIQRIDDYFKSNPNKPDFFVGSETEWKAVLAGDFEWYHYRKLERFRVVFKDVPLFIFASDPEGYLYEDWPYDGRNGIHIGVYLGGAELISSAYEQKLELTEEQINSWLQVDKFLKLFGFRRKPQVFVHIGYSP